MQSIKTILFQPQILGWVARILIILERNHNEGEIWLTVIVIPQPAINLWTASEATGNTPLS